MEASDDRWLWLRLLCGLLSIAISLALIFFIGQGPLRMALSLAMVALLLAYFATFPLASRRR